MLLGKKEKAAEVSDVLKAGWGELARNSILIVNENAQIGSTLLVQAIGPYQAQALLLKPYRVVVLPGQTPLPAAFLVLLQGCSWWLQEGQA